MLAQYIEEENLRIKQQQQSKWKKKYSMS
jgi:hypothetical protein